MSNEEIVFSNLDLIKTCIDCQFAKFKRDKSKMQYKDDLHNDIIIELIQYDNEKLNNAYSGNHLNALITKILVNNLYSNTSRFYNKYLKFNMRSDDIQKLIDKEDE